MQGVGQRCLAWTHIGIFSYPDDDNISTFHKLIGHTLELHSSLDLNPKAFVYKNSQWGFFLLTTYILNQSMFFHAHCFVGAQIYIDEYNRVHYTARKFSVHVQARLTTIYQGFGQFGGEKATRMKGRIKTD